MNKIEKIYKCLYVFGCVDDDGDEPGCECSCPFACVDATVVSVTVHVSMCRCVCINSWPSVGVKGRSCCRSIFVNGNKNEFT